MYRKLDKAKHKTGLLFVEYFRMHCQRGFFGPNMLIFYVLTMLNCCVSRVLTVAFMREEVQQMEEVQQREGVQQREEVQQREGVQQREEVQQRDVI